MPLTCHPPPLPPQIVGCTSEWIDADAPEPGLAQRSARALAQQLQWAGFLGLQAVIIRHPRNLLGAANFAQVLRQVGRPV